MSKNVDHMVAAQGGGAEMYAVPSPPPQDAEAPQPNAGRPTVVSVRLSAQEHARFKVAAEEANVPISTLLRIWGLERLDQPGGADGAEDEGNGAGNDGNGASVPERPGLDGSGGSERPGRDGASVSERLARLERAVFTRSV